jgi:hypothetical protein
MAEQMQLLLPPVADCSVLKEITKSKASAAIFGTPGANARKPVCAHSSGGW